MRQRTFQKVRERDPNYIAPGETVPDRPRLTLGAAFRATKPGPEAATPSSQPEAEAPKAPATKATAPSAREEPKADARPAGPAPADPAQADAVRPDQAPAAQAQAAPVAPLGRRRRRVEGGEATPLEPVGARLRPLARQTARVVATGLPPRRVLGAAWRKALDGLALTGTYVAPPAEEQDRTDLLLTTTWRVEAATLEALRSAVDPFGWEGRWFLVRGQVEPTFWAALDEVLAELEARRGAAP